MMDRAYLLDWARRERNLTQAQLAARAGTSQAALSAYERGLKSPTLKVAERILEAAGFDINLRVHIDWKEQRAPGVRPFWVPNLLWRVEDCFVQLEMPDFLGDGLMRTWDLRDREQRKGAYEQLIRCWGPPEMIRWLDGSLLFDVWAELDLPDPIRQAWRWPIRLTHEPTGMRAMGLPGGEDRWITANAAVRRYEPLPPPPKPKQRRTRFDPRPPETD